MPRGNFNEASKGGGLGFQEGRILVFASYSTWYQYPPNSTTGKQSDEFPALVWDAYRLNDAGKIIKGEDGEPVEVEVVHRMGGKDETTKKFNIRPGKLDAKDFDNLDVEPEEVDEEVGARGNTFIMDTGAKFSRAWGFIKDTLEKLGFKPEILGRGIAGDFVGLDAHFLQQKGEAYVAKKGAKKGESVTPENLVCDKIHLRPYEKDAAANLAAVLKEVGAGSGKKEEKAPGGSGQSSSGNGGGNAGGASSGGADDATKAKAIEVFKTLSKEFKADVKAGTDKGVDRETFQKAMTKELMRKSKPLELGPKVQKAISELVKSAEGLAELAMETEGAVFNLDDVEKPTTLTFSS